MLRVSCCLPCSSFSSLTEAPCPPPEGAKIEASLNAVVEANKLIDSKGITFNDHTTLTLDNCMMEVPPLPVFTAFRLLCDLYVLIY